VKKIGGVKPGTGDFFHLTNQQNTVICIALLSVKVPKIWATEITKKVK